MPQKKAAIKSIRTGKKRETRNSLMRKKIKDLRKKADKFIMANKANDALGVYNQLQKLLDKASKHSGFIKQNTAARYKSHLRKRIHAITKK